MVNAWVADYNTARTLRSASEAREGWMLYAVFMFVIALFLLLPGSLLVSAGWRYFGGGPGFEKIHPATYLLVAVFFWALIVNPSFRWRCIAYSDSVFIAFALAVFLTVMFAIVASGASASNFIDTFVVALIIRTAIVAVPRRPVVQFRSFIDIYCIVTIVIVFAEYMLNRNLIPQTLSNAPTTLISIYDTSTATTNTVFRSTGLFDHPLAAAGFLSLYAILNLVATPVRLSAACAGRLLLAALSFLAIFPTGGRAALVVSALVMFLFIAWSALRSLAKGSFNKEGLVFFVICLAVVVLMLPIMQQLGLFEVMLRRFEQDSGSAASRAYALQVLLNMRFEDLWFGMSPQDALNLQNDYGMVAIENTWINFILSCGLILTMSLLFTYVLYLFVSNPRYCTSGIYYIAIFQLILSNSSNGLWSKNTIFGVFIAVIFSFLRKDMFISWGSTSAHHAVSRPSLADDPRSRQSVMTRPAAQAVVRYQQSSA
jgi:hypothetical protein